MKNKVVMQMVGLDGNAYFTEWDVTFDDCIQCDGITEI